MTNKTKRKVIVEGTRARERHVCSPLGCLEVTPVGTSQPPQVTAAVLLTPPAGTVEAAAVLRLGQAAVCRQQLLFSNNR